MLDTDICIYLIKSKSEILLKKMQSVGFGDVGISSITLAELFYGVEKSQHKQRNHIALLNFMASLALESFNDDAAICYGEIRAHLEKSGNTIGPLDMLIAGHAKSLGATLVTNNSREFSRVPGLLTDNWAV